MWTVQIDAATRRVVALVESVVSTPAPSGKEFVFLAPEICGDKLGQYYVNGQFQVNKP